jgi:cytochrome c biogenesis protein CcdA/thiol-disulfide isomerase/thioredoxin
VLALLLSFIAGLLTALAPCVLPLLPVILGGSFDTSDRDKKRPYIITASLVTSLILFTILLKVSTSLIGIDPRVWSIASGVLVIGLGLFMLFPTLWARVIAGLGIESRSQKALGSAYKNSNKTWSAILTGAALGPVFSSCSPTYAWVIATVLPASALRGLLFLSVYCIGVATSLLAIALVGRKLLAKVKWATNPYGWFQRGIAVLFVLVGIFVVTGYDKKVQTYLVDKDLLKLVSLEKKLVPSSSNSTPVKSTADNTGKTRFNVTPYDAPELTHLAGWVNSEPVTLASLKGKVVLIDFWTYSCINCQRTQPYLNKWYDKYNKDGFVILGVHAPEFAFEKVLTNVQKGVKDAGIKYPVALDNDFATWQAYNNQYWPAKYLIDKDGQVRFTHFGEGEYDKTESAIQTLLKESGKNITSGIDKDTSASANQSGLSPETYLGFERGERLANIDEFKQGADVNYSLKSGLAQHQWSLGGNWNVGSKDTTCVATSCSLSYMFSAKEVYLVMNGPADQPVTLSLNGQKVTASASGGADVDAQGQVHLDGARLYKLISLPKFTKDQLLTITLPHGTTVNAFTFGG